MSLLKTLKSCKAANISRSEIRYWWSFITRPSETLPTTEFRVIPPPLPEILFKFRDYFPASEFMEPGRTQGRHWKMGPSGESGGLAGTNSNIVWKWNEGEKQSGSHRIILSKKTNGLSRYKSIYLLHRLPPPVLHVKFHSVTYMFSWLLKWTEKTSRTISNEFIIMTDLLSASPTVTHLQRLCTWCISRRSKSQSSVIC